MTVALGALVGLAGNSLAGTRTSAMATTLTLQTGCPSISITPLTFPASSPATRNVDSNATLTVNCSQGTLIAIGMSEGDSGLGGRLMSSGDQHLAYQLYLDTERTIVWGDIQGTNPGDATSPDGGQLRFETATGTEQPYAVYGRAFLSSTSAALDYSDSIVVTILF